MQDSEPLGEGGKPWNQENFENFQNLQYQILEEGQCVSTGPACLSFVCFVSLMNAPLFVFVFDERCPLQLTYTDADTSGALASYFTNVVTVIQHQVHLFYPFLVCLLLTMI